MTGTAHSGRWQTTVRLLLALLIGLAGALPLMLRGASCGQDFDFHLQSWLAVRAAWHSGVVAPHWVPAANYGAGEPRLLFYPPGSWLLGALLSLIAPWAWVPWAFTTVTLAALAWSMQRTAAQLMSAAAAWSAAAVYALSPYLLFCAYERGALAELLAGVCFPPLLLWLARDRLPIVRVALIVAALWYTNAPAAVMGIYLVLLAALWSGIAALRAAGLRALAWVWLRAGAALALGCALAADYLIPAWYDERYVSIRRAVGLGMRIRDSLLFLRTGEPYHDQVLHTASWIAVATFLVGLGCAWFARKRHADAGRRVTALCGLTLLVCLVLQLRPALPVWNALPQLAFLQFPWRLLLPSTAAACLLLGMAIERLHGRRMRATCIALTGSVALALVGWAALTRFQPCDDEDNVAAQLLLPTSGGFEGTDEYTAAGSDNNLIQQGAPRVRLLRAPDADEGTDDDPNPAWTASSATAVAGQIDIRSWKPEQLSVRVRPVAPAYAVLLLSRFPGWQVLVNNTPCGTACVPREDGLVAVAVPAGRWTHIDAAFRVSWRIRLGRALSVVGMLLFAAIALRRMRRSRSDIMSRNVD